MTSLLRRNEIRALVTWLPVCTWPQVSHAAAPLQSTLLQGSQRRPGFHRRAPPAALHQSYGVLQGVVQVTSKEPAHSGELSHHTSTHTQQMFTSKRHMMAVSVQLPVLMGPCDQLVSSLLADDPLML